MKAVQVMVCALLTTAALADRYHPKRQSTHTNRNLDGFNTEERDPDFWRRDGVAGIQKRLGELMNNKIAKNVIMFLGDGMSIPTLTAARTYKGQLENRTGEETQMFFENFPTTGLSKTYCLDEQIADSACTATAYLAGIKNNDGAIGVDGRVPRTDCLASMNKETHIDSIAVWALDAGWDVGFVTTARVTHASPAGLYARVADRDWEADVDVVESGFTTDMCPDIAHQLVHTSPGNQLKVILAGGRREMIPSTTVDEEGTPGRRTDNRNLIQEWQDDKARRNVSYKYVWNRSELMSLMNSPPDYLLGLFEGGHMRYHLEADPITEPTLAELTEIAIRSLSRNEKGYFLFAEGGRIDHGHHDNYHRMALDETVEFDKAIQRAVEMVGDDTLIVVTADHGHVMSISGYSRRGNPIVGVSQQLGDDGVPYMTLSYSNGPGARVHYNNTRPNVAEETDFLSVRWQTHADAFLEEETHGGEDVAILAWGPQHHMFSGLYEQSQIAWKMAYAACIGPGLHAEACNSAVQNNPLSIFFSLSLAILIGLLKH